MASIVLKFTDETDPQSDLVPNPSNLVSHFDFPAFTAHLSKSLPTYARPIFLRIRTKEHEKTSTMKFQKFKYVKQSYNYQECEAEGDVVFVWDKQKWTRVDEGIMKGIEEGIYRW
jgi:hypothetical protein